MTEEVKNVHREPHPFVGNAHMTNFIGRTISYVGKIESVGDGELIMHQHNREATVKVIRYRGDLGLTAGMIIEVRGIVNKDGSISFGEYTAYDPEFDLASFETMLGYYHGMCKDLTNK